MKKIKVSKEFIEEFDKLKGKCTWLNSAMDEAYEVGDEYRILNNYLFGNGLETAGKNQLTFAKIWADEIELVENEVKYLIWFKGSEDSCGNAEYMYEDATREHVSSAQLRELIAADDKYCLFDKEIAFALRDTGKFKIKKVGY